MDSIDIKDVILSTEQFWILESKTLFHHIVSQYVTQLVSFKQSRIIRQNLYNILQNPYNQNIFNSLTDEELLSSGINSKQLDVLKHVSLIVDNNNINGSLIKLRELKGIGDWTIKSTILMLKYTEWEQINLFEDAYIRNRIKELYNLKSITPSKAKELIISLSETNSTSVGICSLFLWRINSSGIQHLKEKIPLIETDFIIQYKG
jgi:3-methyladenine DNA glycosylase/8-oxoguanine DNA glycosylase